MNNNEKTISLILMIVVIILGLPTYGCSMKSTVQLQVIDAETKEPIENAVALIYWLRPARFLLIRWPGREDVELKETVSDKTGHFSIPAYSNKDYEYYLTIYKKGYVCWSNREIFPTEEKRTTMVLKDGMVIEMERFKENYDKLDHANFVQSYSVASFALPHPSAFKEAIKEEDDLVKTYYKQLRLKDDARRGK